MNCKDKDLSPKPEFVAALAEEEPLVQAFNSSLVEIVAAPSNRS
jgi:hypothetical protein